MGGIISFVVICGLLTLGVLTYDAAHAIAERRRGRSAVARLRRQNRREWKYRMYTCP